MICWHLVPREVRAGLPLMLAQPTDQVVTVKSILAAQDKVRGSERTGPLTYYITTTDRNVMATVDREMVGRMVPGGSYHVRYVGRAGDEAVALESVAPVTR